MENTLVRECPSTLKVAIRVYPEPNEEPPLGNHNTYKIPLPPDALFVFDTETQANSSQRPTFGSYRFLVGGRCLEEALFQLDDLPAEDVHILEQYVASHKSDTVDSRPLLLLTRSEFLKKFYTIAYKSRVSILGFNLPFDLSRLACDFASARGRYAGGFSFALWPDKSGRKRSNPYRPPLAINYIDSKRAFMGFLSRRSPDASDLIPEGSKDGKPDPNYVFPGIFIDLRTLGYALTAEAGSLESMCEEFGLPYRKLPIERHGVITESYIDYNRNDVRMTEELAKVMLEEYQRHQLDRFPSKVYSIATIGKAYLRKMGIKPILGRQKDFPKAFLGFAESAFFGGRASAHIRKIPVPVVFLDFKSMYTTVNGLMNLWRFVIAREVKVIEDCQHEIETFLRQLTADKLFNPETWKHMTAFVRVIPDGDILPLRCKYGSSESWNIGINYAYGNESRPDDALWYSLPDLAASVLLRNGRIPKIIDAFRIEPLGTQEGLESTVKLRGEVEIDPRQDFFLKVVEERDRPRPEQGRLDRFLKVFTNAASYGIYAQMNRQESNHEVDVLCHGLDAEPYTCTVAHPEEPGEYCFPPLAALITGAARVMLALLEHCVSELGGTYAMEDTDSMAIVATEHGGLVPCPNNLNEHATVNALSWTEVETIRQRVCGAQSIQPRFGSWQCSPAGERQSRSQNGQAAANLLLYDFREKVLLVSFG